MSTLSQLFPFGYVYTGAGAHESIPEEDIAVCLARHQTGDWGDVNAEDKQLNNQAVKDGTRILSAYRSSHGEKFWILTEADRSSTAVLLPEEY